MIDTFCPLFTITQFLAQCMRNKFWRPALHANSFLN